MPLFEQVLENYPTQVRIAFKNFPLPFHRFARQAALAALAADEQGRFWEFHDQLFAFSGDLDNQKIVAIAEGLGLDMERFRRDMAGTAVSRRLDQDLKDGQQAEVAGTPTIFINGRLLEQRSLESFKEIINEELLKTRHAPQGEIKK